LITVSHDLQKVKNTTLAENVMVCMNKNTKLV
jgi:hypothetical protein